MQGRMKIWIVYKRTRTNQSVYRWLCWCDRFAKASYMTKFLTILLFYVNGGKKHESLKGPYTGSWSHIPMTMFLEKHSYIIVTKRFLRIFFYWGEKISQSLQIYLNSPRKELDFPNIKSPQKFFTVPKKCLPNLNFAAKNFSANTFFS